LVPTAHRSQSGRVLLLHDKDTNVVTKMIQVEFGIEFHTTNIAGYVISIPYSRANVKSSGGGPFSLCVLCVYNTNTTRHQLV
jgi:hypothetical protein